MRYPAPDRIRGLALLGILVVNIGFMVGPIGLVLDPPAAQSDLAERTGWWLVRLGFESKFMALFALLFGASVMLAGGDPKRHEARMLRLFPIGVLHGLLLFFGDILHAYAVWGFPWLGYAGCRKVVVALWQHRILLVPRRHHRRAQLRSAEVSFRIPAPRGGVWRWPPPIRGSCIHCS